MTPTLFDLFEHFPMAFQVNEELPCVPVHGIVFDSRLVQAGDVFVALEGVSLDGHRFVQDAQRKAPLLPLECRSWKKCRFRISAWTTHAPRWRICVRHSTVTRRAS